MVGSEREGRMYEFAIFWDWMAFAVRWLHVITGIAWIGSSFYFVALDLGLRKAPVKNTRSMCATIAAMNTKADQWWV